MNKQKDEHHEKDLWFSLPGLLPADHILRVNPVLRMVSLYYKTVEKLKVVEERQFSPNGVRVLLPILQAYPHYGSYEEILASLDNLTLEESRKRLQDNREVSMRPVRRASGYIRKHLRPFGLSVHSSRNLGYLLKKI
jgi:hypothetical protein